MAKSKCFIELEPFIKKGLGNLSNSKILEDHIKDYFGKNSSILAEASIAEKPGFSIGSDQDVMFKCMGVTRAQVADVLKRTTNSDVHKGWAVWNGEQYLAFSMAVRYYAKVKNEKMVELVSLYLGMLFYNSLHRKYFSKFPPKKEVMDYTISTMSNKYDIKRIGSLFGALRKIVQNNHDNALSRLLLTSDDDIMIYQRDLRTRINGFIKSISNAYYTNYENGNYLNVDKDTGLDGEGEEYKKERNSDAGLIYTASESFEIWFMTNRLNERVLRIAASLSSEISSSKLGSILNGIKGDTTGRLRGIVTGLLDYLAEDQQDSSLKAIHSREFSIFCMRVLSKSNSKNENVLRVKINTDSLLEDYCDVFKKTKREATRISYRKAFITYLALALQVQRR